MAEMVTTSVSFPKWTLTAQTNMDVCAEELWVTYGVPSIVMRGKDEHGTEYRKLQISSPDPDNAYSVIATLGLIVIWINGAVQALTAAEYTARGYPS